METLYAAAALALEVLAIILLWVGVVFMAGVVLYLLALIIEDIDDRG